MFYRCNICRMRKTLKCCNMKKLLYFFRKISKTINQFFCHIIHLFFCFNCGNPLINIQFLILVFNVRFRNKCIYIKVNCCSVVCFFFFTFQLTDSLIKHLAIQVISNCCHMATLRLSQKISRTSDLKITHCNLESRSKICKFANCSQPLLCNFFKHLIPLIQQKCICHSIGSPNSSSQLI